MTKDPSNNHSYIDDGVRVALYHQQLLDSVSRSESERAETLSAALNSSEELLASLGYALPENSKRQTGQSAKIPFGIKAQSWKEILAEAQQSTPEQIEFTALLTPREIDTVLKKHAAIGSELSWFDSLNRFDFALSIAAGVIAGALDVLLVGIPAHPGFLGGEGSEGGWLSNVMKEKINNLFPESKIKQMEKMYSVPFDPSTSG